jgi:signal transduction histidine kinase/ligand-binding sensor domain-containing protein
MTAEKKAIGFQWRSMAKKPYSILAILVMLGACQQAKPHLGLEEPSNIPLPLVTFLDSLPDSLQVQTVQFKSILIPEKKYVRIIEPRQDHYSNSVVLPQVVDRPFLRGENGEVILDRAGNQFFLGEGGVSHFKSYTTDDGLGLDNITSSLLDRTGNLWFGTWGGGVSKFDGVSFTNFTTEHGLSNNLVHCLAEDDEGNIWIGTDGGGLSIYDGYGFYQKDDYQWLKNGVIYGITSDRKGNLWIAAGEGGAYLYNGKGFSKYAKEDGLPSSHIIKISVDNNGFIWFGTGNKGVARFDGEAFTLFTKEDGLAENGIYSIYTDKAGNVWFGTKGGGLSKYEANQDAKLKGLFTTFTINDGLGHNDIWDIKEDLEGNIWLATGGGGIARFDGQRFTNYTTSQGLAENVVYSITTDGSGNLWVGTAGGGVSLYKGAAFNNFISDIGIVNSVYGILEDNNGNIWFGTDGGGVSRYDGRYFSNFSTDQGLSNPLVISAIKDKLGQLWFGTGGGGVALYQEEANGNDASFTTFNSKVGLPNGIIYSILEDKIGNIWLGTGGGGLVKFDWNINSKDKTGFQTFTIDQGLANNIVYSLLEDRNGNLWIGTGGGGISKFDGKSFTNYTTDQGLSNNIVWSILEDKAGNLWFATQGGGVSRYNGQAFNSFTRKEGLVDDTVYDLIEDQDGNIFIGTNLGFTVIPFEVTLLPFQEIRSSLEYFNTSNGFPVKDVNKGMYLDSKGNIWAGNGSQKTGLVRFNYATLKKKKEKPHIKIKNLRLDESPISWISLENSRKGGRNQNYITDEVKVFNRELSSEEREANQKEFSRVEFSDIKRFDNFPEKLILPYAQNQLTIDFATNELVSPHAIEYMYILEGYKKGWSPIISNSYATFGNIREGEYVFKVKARYTGPAEGEGKEWSDEAIYKFTVLPPVHRTWWAYLLYMFLLLIGIKRVHVSQKRRTIRKERDKIQQKELLQAKEIEKAYNELQLTQAQLVQQEKLASLGQLTAGIAHEIKNPLNFVNNFSEVSLELIDETLEEINKETATRNEDLIKENIVDIKLNLQKVYEHGTRANGIVTSMLQHSRGGSGNIEPTDLNALIKEYVNLSFHGMRASKSPINVDIALDLDATIIGVPLIKDDFSRVIINLCNNAFDAMRLRSIDEEDYHPILKVRTSTKADNVIIEIIDNGTGIPEEIKDKILQPFFTTKKGTEGTGLGLSITHDIVKAHGGTMEIESIINEGTTFIVTLTK